MKEVELAHSFMKFLKEISLLVHKIGIETSVMKMFMCIGIYSICI